MGEKAISDAEISLLAQFIDVLEVIENYETIEEVKEDIIQRKKYIKDEIKLVENKQKEKKTTRVKKNKCKIIRLAF